MDQTKATDANRDCNINTSILLEPSEYFYDDDFSVPFDANLRDENGGNISHRALEESDEGISSSGATHGDTTVGHILITHSRSDSCLFSPPDSGDSGQSANATADNRKSELESPMNLNSGGSVSQLFSSKSNVCRPDSTSAPFRRLHLLSNNLSPIPPKRDKTVDCTSLTFSRTHLMNLPDPLSVTNSWMQAVMEGSCNPELKELLQRTAEALDYKLAWDDVPTEGGDGSSHPGVSSPRIQRSTSQGNLWTTASLLGMRQTLAAISSKDNAISKKQMRSVGVATEDACAMNSDVNATPDTTTPVTTTWARKRSSRESLNNRRFQQEDSAKTPPLTSSPPSFTPKTTNPTQIPRSTLAWRTMKLAAGNELITWGQLKRTASLASRRTQCDVKNELNPPQNIQAASLPVKPTQTSLQLSAMLRSRSDCSPLTNNLMHRYSGTLLEIFMRARAHDMITSTISCSSHDQPQILRQLGPNQADLNVSRKKVLCSKSFQTTACTVFPEEGPRPTVTPRMSRLSTEDNQNAFTVANCPPIKASQPPIVPPRRSSANAQRLITFHDSRRLNRRDVSNAVAINRASLDAQALLTTSADPSSECMSRLREAAISPTYIRNPRATIAYPGLGVLAVPKPSRIECHTFLSQTLPDLSLLCQAAAEEARSGTPTMPKYAAVETAGTSKSRRAASATAVPLLRRQLARRGTSSAARGKLHQQHRPGGNCDEYSVFPCGGVPPDLLADFQSSSSALKANNIDRFISEPDVSLSTDHQHEQCRIMTASMSDGGHHTTGYILEPCNYSTTIPHSGDALRFKKCVSFSGKMCNQGMLEQTPCNAIVSQVSSNGRRYQSPDPKVIPRNWGLYGQNPPPLAEFKPAEVVDQNDVSSSTRPSDEDIRYHAMVGDVIKAVQETVAFFCQLQSVSFASSDTTLDSMTAVNSGRSSESCNRPQHQQLKFSSLVALGSSGEGSLLAVVGPIMTLLSDGILPPVRPFFVKPSRSRVWQFVEESCRPSAYLSGVAPNVLGDVLNKVRSIPGAPTEKARLKAFICACLNSRALPMWLNSLVANEPLLKRFYCDGAFIRQCRTALRGLHADLMTHIEQLVAYPFNFDISVEARRSTASTGQHSSTSGSSSSGRNSLPRGSAKAAGSSTSASKKPMTPKKTIGSGMSTIRGAQLPRHEVTKFGPPLNANSVTQNVNTRNVGSKVTPITVNSRAAARANTNRPMMHASAGSANKQVFSNTESAEAEASSSPSTTSRVPLPGKIISPLASPSMRGKLRTALSTFRRSTGHAELNQPINGSRLPKVAQPADVSHYHPSSRRDPGIPINLPVDPVANLAPPQIPIARGKKPF